MGKILLNDSLYLIVEILLSISSTVSNVGPLCSSLGVIKNQERDSHSLVDVVESLLTLSTSVQNLRSSKVVIYTLFFVTCKESSGGKKRLIAG